MVRLATREVADAEEAEVEHRVAGARLVEQEEREAGDAGDQRHPDQRVAPAVGRLLDQGEDRAAEARGREPDPGPVDAAKGIGIAALLDRAQGEHHGDRDQRQVDPEDRPPGEQPDQGAAAGRPEHGRDPGPGGPGADRLAALGALEGGGDDRQRARHQQRPGDPLQGPGADQELDRGRDRAEHRGGAEGDQPGDEHPPTPELVAERAADQEQRDHRQHVGLDHPLLPREAGVEVVADRRQGDVDHGRVEEDDGRAEDRRDQGQALLAGHPVESTGGRSLGARDLIRAPVTHDGFHAHYPYRRSMPKQRKRARAMGDWDRGVGGGHARRQCCASGGTAAAKGRPRWWRRRRHGRRLPLPLRRDLAEYPVRRRPSSSDRRATAAGSTAGGTCRAPIQCPPLPTTLQRRRPLRRRLNPRPQRRFSPHLSASRSRGSRSSNDPFTFEWDGPGGPPTARQFRSASLSGETYSFDAISPSGATVYLTRYPIARGRELDASPSYDFVIGLSTLGAASCSRSRSSAHPRHRSRDAGLPITRAMQPQTAAGPTPSTTAITAASPSSMALDTVAGHRLSRIDAAPCVGASPTPSCSSCAWRTAGARLSLLTRSPELEGARAPAG